jgi:hypothetical protein
VNGGRDAQGMYHAWEKEEMHKKNLIGKSKKIKILLGTLLQLPYFL